MGCNRLPRKSKDSIKESKNYIKAYNPKYKLKNFKEAKKVGTIKEIDGVENYYCPKCAAPLDIILHNNQEYIYCKCLEDDYDKPVD